MRDYFVKLAVSAMDTNSPVPHRVRAVEDLYRAIRVILRAVGPGRGDLDGLIDRHVRPRRHVYVDRISRLGQDREIPAEVSALFRIHLARPPQSRPLYPPRRTGRPG